MVVLSVGEERARRCFVVAVIRWAQEEQLRLDRMQELAAINCGDSKLQWTVVPKLNLQVEW
jgi:hypothetical protein